MTIKNITLGVLAVALLSVPAATALAAAPDYLGPWADGVIYQTQGLTNSGNAVRASRSNPRAAVGVAEDNTLDASMFSLGFGGQMILGFKNSVSSRLRVVEATNMNYPNEKLRVEIGHTKNTWVDVGTLTFDGEVEIPDYLQCSHFVRLTDVSDVNDFPVNTYPDADAYDVDGVQAVGNVPANCTPIK